MSNLLLLRRVQVITSLQECGINTSSINWSDLGTFIVGSRGDGVNIEITRSNILLHLGSDSDKLSLVRSKIAEIIKN